MNSEEVKRLVAKSENAAVEFKRARGGVPADFWPSYSSFSNTDGGVIILGVREKGEARQETVRAPKAARDIFAEFKDDPDLEVRQRASNWSVAIGLQDVDHLSVSQFLIDTAKRNIRGEITQEEVARLIEEYHSMGRTRKGECRTKRRERSTCLTVRFGILITVK